jgi:hypothetical protein
VVVGRRSSRKAVAGAVTVEPKEAVAVVVRLLVVVVEPSPRRTPLRRRQTRVLVVVDRRS